jgi:hypothetical protein
MRMRERLRLTTRVGFRIPCFQNPQNGRNLPCCLLGSKKMLPFTKNKGSRSTKQSGRIRGISLCAVSTNICHRCALSISMTNVVARPIICRVFPPYLYLPTLLVACSLSNGILGATKWRSRLDYSRLARSTRGLSKASHGRGELTGGCSKCQGIFTDSELSPSKS